MPSQPRDRWTESDRSRAAVAAIASALGHPVRVGIVDETAAVAASRRHAKFTARSVWYPNRIRS